MFHLLNGVLLFFTTYHHFLGFIYSQHIQLVFFNYCLTLLDPLSLFDVLHDVERSVMGENLSHLAGDVYSLD